MAATAPKARASRPTLEPSEEALRPEQSDQQIRREHEGVLERRRQVDDGHALDHADDEGGQQRAEDAAEPAEGDDGVREHGELQPDLRIDGEEVDEDGAGDGDEGGAEAPRDGEHALRPDADETGRVAILAGGLQRQPELRPLDQQIQREEEQEREPGRRQQRHPEGDAEQPQLGAAQPREEAVADEAVVAREAGHDGVLQQEQQADGGEDLRERIAALHAAHEGAIDEHAKAEHGEPERHDGEQRIQTEPGAEPPCAEHPEHEELAVGEVDHLHQAIVNGLEMGFLYALVAVGLTIIWGLMEMINFAHGEFLMLGMFGAWWASVAFGLDPLVAVGPVGLAMYALGVLIYRQLMRRVQQGDPFTQIFATVGLLFLLQNSAVAVFTSDYRYLSNTLLTRLSDANLHILGITVGVPLLIGALLALVLFLGLYLLIDRTEFGLALQATAEDREAAMLVGIRPQKMFAVAWGLGAALVAVAGTILANFFAVFPQVGFPFTVLAYAIVALGGFGSILATLLAP